MMVATLTNKAVTAIFNASSNQYANSGDTKCILGEGEAIYVCRLATSTGIPALLDFCSSLHQRGLWKLMHVRFVPKADIRPRVSSPSCQRNLEFSPTRKRRRARRKTRSAARGFFSHVARMSPQRPHPAGDGLPDLVR